MNYQVTYNLLNQTINSIIVRDIAHCALQGIYVHSWRKRSPGQLPSAGNCFLITPFLALLVSEVVDHSDDDRFNCFLIGDDGCDDGCENIF